jgi:hypothetical protein
MGKRRNIRDNRPQTQKDREASRVRRVQELRRSNASEPVPSGARYDRNAFRNATQRGQWGED